MINKKLLTSTAIASLMISSAGFAQKNNFAGPSLAISASQVAAETHSQTLAFSYLTYNPTQSVGILTSSQSSRVGGLDLNYGIAISNNFVLGVGATYDFGKIKSGTNIFGAGQYDEDSEAFEGVTTQIKSSLKNHRSIYIQPTYVVNKDSAIFAKVGKHYAKSTINIAHCQAGSANEEDVGVVGACTSGDGLGDFAEEGYLNNSKSVSGWGYGLGLKMFITDNLFVQAEAGVVKYKRHDSSGYYSESEDASIENSSKTKTSNATISVGYKF